MKKWAIASPRERSTRISFEDKGAAFIISSRKASSLQVGHWQQQLQGDYALLLRAIKTPAQGHLIQARIKKDGLQNDPFLISLLIQMYGKRGSLADARLLFDSMAERPMLAWKAIIRAYVQDGHCSKALQLYQQLLQEGFVPDKYTFVSVLTVCANKADLACGRHFHAIVLRNTFNSDIAVGTALVNMYGKCDSLIMGVEIFEGMHLRHVIIWNVLIAAHVKHNQGDTALLLFHQMKEEGVLPNRITFINVLSLCVTTCAVQHVGEEVHAISCTPEFQSDVAMGNALLNMYCKSGWLQVASIVFDGLLTQNLVSWTSMIEAYTQEGQGRRSFQCFEQMQQQGALPDQVTYIGVLEACAAMRGLYEGKWVHARLAAIGLESTAVVGTALVRMYGSCGIMEWASTVFDSMTHPNVMSWTSMIALRLQHRDETGMLQWFSQMVQEGFLPDKVVFFSLLDVCYRQADVLEGKRVYSLLIGAGHELDDNARATLVSLYFSPRSLEEIRRLFDGVSELGIATWTSMIAACTEHGQDLTALQLFCQMQQEGMIPDDLAFVTLLKACSNLPSLVNGRQIHTYITHRSLHVNSISIEAALINMYGKCGDIRGAETVFDGALEHNLISLTALLAAYVHHGESRRALQVLKWLAGQSYKLDDTTFSHALLACCRSGLVDEALTYFLKMVGNYPIKLGLDHFCCVIDLFSRAGLLEGGEALTHAIPCQPSAALWMALLGACRQQVDVGRAERAAAYVAELNQSQGGHYVVLSNIYALVGRYDENTIGVR